MLEDGAFSHKIDWVRNCLEILNLRGHQNHNIGSKVITILLNEWVLQIDGVASRRVSPTACAWGCFFYSLFNICFITHSALVCIKYRYIHSSETKSHRKNPLTTNWQYISNWLFEIPSWRYFPQFHSDRTLILRRPLAWQVRQVSIYTILSQPHVQSQIYTAKLTTLLMT